ncbi:hypothetical protein H9Q69_014212 [Fusarium xylarioides]|uniref:Uncharacterized protein n=1 Tax=Fusarium xylarioides TaxID=221167 RepID=A0A9P7HIL8_9HYPO|nr:hypothetical protein H9Q70_002589 [Fusarium xylarioides]KAG5760269.1 hypothetical protein H9Q72_011606 [Fusarium xylarioides]KAG5779996.1 hypothetical protein H9Q73_006353 [Fusarium xylarioides]KAG5786710.1 hypothetical protein H9Q69_014212 [Fusarium xylarioides]KAG5801681.1 hypothetical protein H9Q71_013736 [Fusarium xylarioides]
MHILLPTLQRRHNHPNTDQDLSAYRSFTVAVVLTKTIHRSSSSYAPQVQSPETTQTHTRLGAYRLRRGC